MVAAHIVSQGQPPSIPGKDRRGMASAGAFEQFLARIHFD